MSDYPLEATFVGTGKAYECQFSLKGKSVRDIVLNGQLKIIRPDLCDIEGVTFGNDCVVKAAMMKNVTLGDRVRIYGPANIYGNDKSPTKIGNDSRVATYVEIQNGVSIGERCKISSHSFLCEGVTIDDEVFVGHGVMFTNDLWPASVNDKHELKGPNDWTCTPTYVGKGVSIGSGAKVLCGIKIGDYAQIGLGAVVVKDVQPYSLVVGNPARRIKTLTPNDIIRIQQGKTPGYKED